MVALLIKCSGEVEASADRWDESKQHQQKVDEYITGEGLLWVTRMESWIDADCDFRARQVFNH